MDAELECRLSLLIADMARCNVVSSDKCREMAALYFPEIPSLARPSLTFAKERRTPNADVPHVALAGRAGEGTS